MNLQHEYTARDVARIFGLQESRVLYWARTGVVGPSRRRGARTFYTFQDLITVKTAKELIDGGLSLQSVRKNLAALRGALPDRERGLSGLRIVSNGERLVVVENALAYEPLSGQLVMDFAVDALASRIAEVMELPRRAPGAGPDGEAAPGAGAAEARDEERARSAYGWFQRGCILDEEEGRPDEAEEAYRRAIELDPQLAAAHTNLGTLVYRLGRRGDARELFERALSLDPEQPEARYNLANLLDDLGEGERAVIEWTRVVALSPEFADAHFNLGLALSRRGERDAARAHLRRYLALDSEGASVSDAEALLARLEGLAEA